MKKLVTILSVAVICYIGLPPLMYLLASMPLVQDIVLYGNAQHAKYLSPAPSIDQNDLLQAGASSTDINSNISVPYDKTQAVLDVWNTISMPALVSFTIPILALAVSIREIEHIKISEENKVLIERKKIINHLCAVGSEIIVRDYLTEYPCFEDQNHDNESITEYQRVYSFSFPNSFNRVTFGSGVSIQEVQAKFYDNNFLRKRVEMRKYKPTKTVSAYDTLQFCLNVVEPQNAQYALWFASNTSNRKQAFCDLHIYMSVDSWHWDKPFKASVRIQVKRTFDRSGLKFEVNHMDECYIEG